MTLTDLEMNIQPVAPDYQVSMVTIRDRYGVQTRWMVNSGQKLETGDLETLTLMHVRFSQGSTRRN